MLEGSNKLILCEKEMNNAVQYYCENVLFKAGFNKEVTKVQYNTNDYTFSVTLSDINPTE